jgi:hypothetical protein
MSRYFIADPRSGKSNEIAFSDAVTLLKGTSILSLADAEGFLELGLSENLLLRIEGRESGTLNAAIISTLNPDEIAATRLQLIADGEEPSAALVEHRLHNLRQVYAVAYLLNDGRGEELANAVRNNPGIDVEQSLLKEYERLYLQAAAPGSWFVTAITKVRGAGQAALYGMGALYGEGRGLLLERLRTANKIQAEELKKRQIENAKAAADAAIDIANKLNRIKDPESREAVRVLLLSHSNEINPRISGLLPPPGKDDR